jgi:hypothetical protein
MFPPLLVLSCKHSLDPIAGFEHMRLVCWHAVEEKSKPESLMNIRTWPWSITLDGSSMMNSSYAVQLPATLVYSIMQLAFTIDA